MVSINDDLVYRNIIIWTINVRHLEGKFYHLKRLVLVSIPDNYFRLFKTREKWKKKLKSSGEDENMFKGVCIYERGVFHPWIIVFTQSTFLPFINPDHAKIYFKNWVLTPA